MLEIICTIIGIAMLLTLLALAFLCGMVAPLLIDHEACQPAPGSDPDPGSDTAGSESSSLTPQASSPNSIGDKLDELTGSTIDLYA